MIGILKVNYHSWTNRKASYRAVLIENTVLILLGTIKCLKFFKRKKYDFR